jgi:hypothetical protein
VAKLSSAQTASGNASLQNALEMATLALGSVPPYGHREVVMLFAALSTCDPGNVWEAVRAAKEARVRISIVGGWPAGPGCLPAERPPCWCARAVLGLAALRCCRLAGSRQAAQRRHSGEARRPRGQASC